MIFDPTNELTDDQLELLSDDNLFEYLDAKADYLKQFTKPLDTHHLKQFSAADMGLRNKEVTLDDLKRIKKLGKENEMSTFDEDESIEWKEKKHEMLKRICVKNVKTHRSQWFD